MFSKKTSELIISGNTGDSAVCLFVCVCVQGQRRDSSKKIGCIQVKAYILKMLFVFVKPASSFFKLITIVSLFSVHLSLTKRIISSISQCIHIRLACFLCIILLLHDC